MTREEAESIWNAAWDAAVDSERQLALLEPDEGFACNAKEWCFDLWAMRNGLPPRPVVLMPTTTGYKTMLWNQEKKTYEEASSLEDL